MKRILIIVVLFVVLFVVSCNPQTQHNEPVIEEADDSQEVPSDTSSEDIPLEEFDEIDTVEEDLDIDFDELDAMLE
jgi:protein involved in sex pheromone biosynthesis